MEDGDDFFSTPGEGSDRAQGGTGDPLVESEFQRIATRYSDAGYREGITSGKLSTLQQGFDQGFLLSAAPARRLGALRGRAGALLSYLLMPIRTTFPRPESSTPLNASEILIGQLRDLIRELGKVKRDDILPPDREREEHEAEHGEGEEREPRVEDLERGMEGLGGRAPHGPGWNSGEGKEEAREAVLLQSLEARLRDIDTKALGQ